MYPTFDLITAPTTISGIIRKAREIATEQGGNFRAPHFTVSRAGMVGEMALAAGGVLLLDEPAEFSRTAINAVAHIWAAMDPACRPRLILTIRGNGDDATTASKLARIVDLFDGWTIAEHHVAASFRR